MQCGERLDGAHHNTIDESAIIVERISQRELIAPAQAVKEILLSLVSRPALENRELQLVS